MLGSLWSLSCNGPPGATAHLFWSGGVNPAGSLIVPGSSCLHYLDEASLLSLLSQGAEPIVIATLPSTPPSTVTWTFPLPSFPFYAGLVIGVQAIVVSPTGTIPLGGGVFVQTTNALQILLGY